MGAVTPFGKEAEMLVGQPMKILVAFTTAVIQCQCEAKAVLPLQGLNKITRCPSCGNAYAIAKSGMVKVGLVTNAPGADH